MVRVARKPCIHALVVFLIVDVNGKAQLVFACSRRGHPLQCGGKRFILGVPGLAVKRHALVENLLLLVSRSK